MCIYIYIYIYIYFPEKWSFQILEKKEDTQPDLQIISQNDFRNVMLKKKK